MVVALFKCPNVHTVKMDFKMLPWVQNLLYWQLFAKLLQWHMEQPVKLQDISLFIQNTLPAETSFPTCKKMTKNQLNTAKWDIHKNK